MPLNPHLTLRGARAADWPAVAALLQSQQLPTAGAQDHLSSFVLAVHDDRIVACAGAEVHGDVALLRSVAVAADRQGQGIGQRLVQQVIADLRCRGIRQLGLLTTTASPWFCRLGFEARPVQQAPSGMKASVEFQGVCPASATFMVLNLADAGEGAGTAEAPLPARPAPRRCGS